MAAQRNACRAGTEPGAAIAGEPDWDLETGDLAHARENVSRCLQPFDLATGRSGGHFARFLSRGLGNSRLAVVEYGERVTIRTAPTQHFMLFQVPLRGRFDVSSRGQRVACRPGSAHLLDPDFDMHLSCSADCRMAVLRIDEPALLTALRTRGDAAALSAGMIDLHRGRGVSTANVLGLLWAELRRGGLLGSDGDGGGCEPLLLQSLELALDPLQAPGPLTAVRERCVRDAERYLLEHLEEPITRTALVEAAGVSERTLYRAFLAAHGEAPFSWLRTRRLELARQRLLEGDGEAVTVSRVALECGFTHFGRFAQRFRERFGESPREALRRARRQRTG